MPPRRPQSGERLHPGVPGRAAAPVPRPRPPPLSLPLSPPRDGTVTRPPGSTIVRPPGSGNDPCRNQAGDPASEGPCVGGCDCEAIGVPKNETPTTTAAIPVKFDRVISTSWIIC